MLAFPLCGNSIFLLVSPALQGSVIGAVVAAAPTLMLASGLIVTGTRPTLRPRKFQVRRPCACHVVIFVRGQYSR